MTNTYQGTNGNDTFVNSYNLATSIIYTYDGNDIIHDSYAPEYIDAGAGNDNIYSYFGSDTLIGGAGNDAIIAYDSAVDSLIDGGTGDDYILSIGSASIYAGSGNDTVAGNGSSAFEIYGNFGDDYISSQAKVADGGIGNDFVEIDFSDASYTPYFAYGRSGNDRLAITGDRGFAYGGKGNDEIISKGGKTTLYGGSGFDRLEGYYYGEETYVISNSEGYATIVGYQSYVPNHYDSSKADSIKIQGKSKDFRVERARVSGNHNQQDTLIYAGDNLVGVIEDTLINKSDLNFGKFLGDNAIDFDQYLASHTDLIGAFGNAQHSYRQSISLSQQHYNLFGFNESRTLDSFDEAKYLASHPDLISAFGNQQHSYDFSLDLATQHYIEFGASEGRALGSFNAQSYLNNYSDLSAAFGDDLSAATQHYIEFGASEGRTF